MGLFEIKNLTYYYPEAARPALEQISLAVEEGEFLLVVGLSGSGKSSLARVLAGLIPDFYGGRIGGSVLYCGRDLSEIERSALTSEVGIVFQDPEKQLVMTGVESEIAFGLENLGLPREEMFRRVAEVTAFMGLNSWRGEFTANLSGGQKQKLALASVLAMNPRVLILDEPTSQLDPFAAEELLNLVKRLNEEFNVTVVLTEQRLSRCYHLADRVVLMHDGKILADGPPDEVASWQAREGFPLVPPVASFFSRAGHYSPPLTVKEGRKCIKSLNRPVKHRQRDLSNAGRPGLIKGNGGKPVVESKNIWFTYPGGREVLRGVNLSVRAGEVVAVMGENSAGKTTLLKNLTGLLKPGRGTVYLDGNDMRNISLHQAGRLVGFLSQNPGDYLFQDTVRGELLFTLENLGLPDEGRADRVMERLGIKCYQNTNPRDLSSGERQRVALASVLVSGPRLLVLDEPTRGIDPVLKSTIGKMLVELAGEGTAVVLVTHDVEFAAEYAGRVVLLHGGTIACDGRKHEVMAASMFYAPQIGRLFRDIDSGVLTVEEALEWMQWR